MSVLGSALSWTQISRSDVSKATEILRGDERGIRDEIGFLALHQGFADRFFPGTSVLQTRLRYVLFVPWQMNDAVERGRGRAGAARAEMTRSEQRLVDRLLRGTQTSGESSQGIIGSRSPNHDPGQPPSTIFWSALREWRVLQPLSNRRTPSRDYVLSGEPPQSGVRSDDGGEQAEASRGGCFYDLPDPPQKWADLNNGLTFKLEAKERSYLWRQISTVNRPKSANVQSLLACMALAGPQEIPWSKAAFEGKELRAVAKGDDKEALEVASYASALAHIGRAAYSALVEQVAEDEDNESVSQIFRNQLKDVVSRNRGVALRCSLSNIESAIGELEPHFRHALQQTIDWLQRSHRNPSDLLASYKAAERYRKPGRARLADYSASRTLRRAWLEEPEERKATGLNFRWNRVGQLVDDLNGV